ncbi:DUF2225 domain-containing protein [Pseudoalteromonas holothuriae]|uniref:DUF2225 domain-containing protein n=1 Tax=Pseudoalteromonas holothuriae TaxID=2963714 RepID=UPI0021BF0BE2|nr:DUF2225 domain-containing protein [Pseudoalteromonas sp. CIP111854]
MLKYFYIFTIFLAFNTSATKWSESSVDDPFKSGSKCLVNNVLSSGSYVFNWPSKYDQIFFPYTSSAAIWFCKDSGYISFMSDFDNITEEEKSKISTYLKANPQRNVRSLISKLKLIDVIYSFRKASPELSNRNKRILAYLYEQKDKFEVANNYRRAALTEIYELLKTDLTKYKRLEYLYVAANYERQLGNTSNSDKNLTTLQKEIESIQTEELKGFGNYLSKLLSDTPLIKPGGKLEPVIEVVKKEVTPKIPNKIDTWIAESSDKCRSEIQAIYLNIKPMFGPHIERTIIEKSIDELLIIRRLFIDTGDISQQTFDDYSLYNGAVNFSSKVNELKAKRSPLCINEINNFTDKLSLDFSQHMERVINDITTDARTIRDNLAEQGAIKSRKAIDQLLVDNSIRSLYCYVRDYDVSEHEVCPEKSLPFKKTFKKVQVDILQFPLKIDDEIEIQKLLKGLSSIGI